MITQEGVFGRKNSVMDKRGKKNEDEESKGLKTRGLGVDGESSRGSMSVQTRVVASVVPPVLNSCNDLLTMLLFLDQYRSYVQLGGDIPLINCAMEVVLNRLDEDTDWSKKSTEDLTKELVAAYAPRSVFAFYGLLQAVQIRNQGTAILNVDSIQKGTRLYVRIVREKASLAIAR